MLSARYALHPLSVLAWVIILMPLLCTGQAVDEPKSYQFQWGIEDNTDSLPVCQNLSLTYVPMGTNTSTPPYYMMAYPLGGTPRIYPLGSSNTSWTWVNDYPPNTRLMLNVLDSNGSAGGIPAQLFTSVNGTNGTDCIVNDGPSDFTISANASGGGDLYTCEPWAVTVQGGVPPYTFMLPALNSPIITNYSTTMVEYNVMVYINRADPNGHLLVAASDSSGKLAYGSPWVHTTGSTDYNCTGLNTYSTTSAKLEADRKQQARTLEASKKKRKRTIGATVGVVGSSLIVVVAIGLCWRRRRQRKRNEKDLTTPRVYDTEEAEGYGSIGRTATYLSGGSRVLSYDGLHSPPPSAGRSGKGLTALDHQRSGSNLSDSTGVRRVGADGVTELIVQHEDAGLEPVVVRELPPPYADRAAARAASSTIGSETAFSATTSDGLASTVPSSDTTNGREVKPPITAASASSSTPPNPITSQNTTISNHTTPDTDTNLRRGEKRREGSPIVPLPRIPTPMPPVSYSPTPTTSNSLRGIPLPPIPPSPPHS